MNHFYTASYLGAQLNQLFCSESKIEIPRNWHLCMINDKKIGFGKITHILFYESLLKVSRNFCKRYAEYFTGQERYLVVRYIIKLLCFDILRKNYFDVHAQNIQFVYSSKERDKLEILEKDNEKCLDKMVGAMDFSFLVEDLFLRYFPKQKMERKEYLQILEEMQRQECLPSSYLQQCDEKISKWTSNPLFLNMESSNEEMYFRSFNLYLEQDERNYRFHIHKETKSLESFFKPFFVAETRYWQSSNFKIEWKRSPNRGGYTRQKIQQNVSIKDLKDPIVEKDLSAFEKKRRGDRKARRQ